MNRPVTPWTIGKTYRDMLPDQTIAERLDEIERALKFDPAPWYREELKREYLALTTDPEEAK